jgi:Tol biopolymer transport system component
MNHSRYSLTMFALVAIILLALIGCGGGGGDPSPTPTPIPTQSPNPTPPPILNGRIVFQSNRDGNDEIYVMDNNGSNQTRLTNNTTSDNFPFVSFDGKKITFTNNSNSNIYMMDINGDNQTKVTSKGGFISSFLPNGKIIFTNFGNVKVINPDGSNQITLDANGYGAFFSPDGTKIAFTSERDGNYEIYVMNADGTNQTNLTKSPVSDSSPLSWSPDGKKIAFGSDRDGNSEIYIMNVDGGNQIRLTSSTFEDFAPSFSPDGTKIAFNSDRDGNNEIYVMNADGSSQTRLTNDTFDDSFPSWSGYLSSK